MPVGGAITIYRPMYESVGRAYDPELVSTYGAVNPLIHSMAQKWPGSVFIFYIFAVNEFRHSVFQVFPQLTFDYVIENKPCLYQYPSYAQHGSPVFISCVII